MKEFLAVLRHDTGISSLKVFAETREKAKQKIMESEGCPENAIESVEEYRTPYQLTTSGIEAGAAGLIVQLRNGAITMRHGTTGEILFRKTNVKPNSWEKIVEAIRSTESIND